MKETGIVRKMDVLGRVSIPIEIRRKLDINIRDGLEFYVQDDRIILKKYAPGCALCGSVDGVLFSFRDKCVCKDCISEMPAGRNEAAAVKA